MADDMHVNPADMAPESRTDPYLHSAFPLRDRARRQLWNLCHALLYRPSPRTLHAWRAWLLRCFGAQLGSRCHFYPGSKVWAPWNLVCADQVTVADGAEIYNPALIRLGSHAILSQGAFLCSATHDYNDLRFPLRVFPMDVGAYAWICARACVAPGANVGEGAVLGLGSVATKDLAAWSVYAGVPALKVKERVRTTGGSPVGPSRAGV